MMALDYLALSGLQTASYISLFVLIIFFGPWAIFSAALLSLTGIFNPYIIIITATLASVIVDLAYFFIGRFASKSFSNRLIKRFGFNKGKIDRLIKNYPAKSISLIKITPPHPGPGLIIAGFSGLKIRTFIIFSIVFSFLYSTIFVGLGYYLSRYFNITSSDFMFILLLIFILVLAYFLVMHLIKKRKIPIGPVHP